MTSRLIIAGLSALLLSGCATDGVREPDAASRMRVAAVAESHGQMDVALSMYGAAAAQEPDNAQAQMRLAGALTRAGNHAQAEQVLAAAVQRRPHERAMVVQLARLRLRSGQAGEALTLFDRVLAGDSRSVEALDGRGVALDLMGRHPEAQESYRRAQVLAPNSVSVANNLGLSLLLDNRPDEARAVLEPLARRPDATERVTANYGIALAATGDVVAARTVLGEAGGDVAALGEAFRGGNRQIIEVTPSDRRS
ncbi:tetratricopeptide repeat protein [Roseomonas terrae]|uniref:Tetratricopeptide repeat protein n=1 Tax=Neoroseomonas terrae TaxID=424799 RepID=A0ABS5EMR7_9PROT|nr:tetratricopeptide repeat protein [Neoroseomonas terrae]MBR0652323.1 tetratricopeptide repeat protein [Neoroseomonas terrae]